MGKKGEKEKKKRIRKERKNTLQRTFLVSLGSLQSFMLTKKKIPGRIHISIFNFLYHVGCFPLPILGHPVWMTLPFRVLHLMSWVGHAKIGLTGGAGEANSVAKQCHQELRHFLSCSLDGHRFSVSQANMIYPEKNKSFALAFPFC